MQTNHRSVQCPSPYSFQLILAFISEQMSKGYYMRKLVEITVLRYCLVLFLQPSNQYHYCKGSLDSAQWAPQGAASNNVAVKVIIHCGNCSSGLRELYFKL